MFRIRAKKSSVLTIPLTFSLLFFCCQIFSQNAPTARADTFYVCPGDTNILYPLANDNDTDGDSIFLGNFFPPPPIINPPSGSYTRVGNTVVFVALPSFANSVIGGYQVCDTTGRCTFGTYILILDTFCNGQKQNRPPVANPDFIFVFEDLSSLLRPLQNDSDPDGDPLYWEPVTQPLNGTLTPSGSNYFYRGNPDYNGFDFFLYRACDTAGRCATSVVTLSVTPINDRPVATNDTFTIEEDQTLIGSVLLNDFDVDGDILKVSVFQKPFNGTVSMDSSGFFQYKPNLNYFGRDEFVYRVCDTARFFNCAQARVLINILPVNDFPELGNITVDIKPTQNEYAINLAEKTTDPENDAIVYLIDAPPANSSNKAMLDSTSGLLILQVPGNFCGLDSLTVKVCDFEGCNVATVFISGPDCTDEIVLSEGFSPNGDGKNDKLYFKGLEQFAPVYLVVFDRNGLPVYESENYLNDWEGKNSQNGQPLPDGTYYYILEVPKTQKRYKNFLVIHR
ncbi:MAG: Ig-like domain-containing protein [Chitinophagales bacterium]|nr:Ig-like domain-containing protein [Chitinophagales bacterium]